MAMATDYPVVGESNKHGSISVNSSGNRSAWSQVVRGGDVSKPHLRTQNHELSGKPAAKPAWKKPSDGSSVMATVMGAKASPALAEDPPRHLQTAQSIAVTQVSTTLNSGGGNNFQNPTASLKRQKSGGRCAATANGMPQVVPIPSFYLIAGVPPLAVHDYIMPGGSNHLIPEGYPDPMFKGPSGMESGFKGLMPGSGNTDDFRNCQQQIVDGYFPRGDVNPFPNNFDSRRNNLREPGWRFNNHWHSQQSYNAIDSISMQSRFGPGNFPWPTPPPSPFIGPPPPGYINTPGFHGGLMYYVPAAPPEPIRAVPYFAHCPPPPGVIMPDSLGSRVIKQIDYYFSIDNLCKDLYLRSHMDAQGWVAISVIANFNRVRSMTTDINFILDVLRSSNVVEVEGDKVRKRTDWFQWLLSHFNSVPNAQPQQIGNDDKVANNVKSTESDHRYKSVIFIDSCSQKPSNVLSSRNDDMNASTRSSSDVCNGQLLTSCERQQKDMNEGGSIAHREASLDGSSDSRTLDIGIGENTSSDKDIYDNSSTFRIINSTNSDCCSQQSDIGNEKESSLKTYNTGRCDADVSNTSLSCNVKSVPRSRGSGLSKAFTAEAVMPKNEEDTFILDEELENDQSTKKDQLQFCKSQTKDEEEDPDVNDQDVQRLIKTIRIQTYISSLTSIY